MRIKDTSTTRQRWSDTQLTNLINEAERDVENQTLIIQASTTVSLIVGTSYYVMPSDFLDYFRVVYVSSMAASNSTVLQETSLYQLDSLNQNINWKTITGIPINYYQDPASPGSMYIYPVPSTSTQLGTVEVNYVQKFSPLVNTTDQPFNSLPRYQDYSDLLIYYPAAVVFAVEGESEKATNYFTLYSSRIATMIKTVGRKPNFIPGFSGPANSR